ncbi:hypothetical protein CCP3SC1_470018 [Gammaproteobacteria bacterium]
MTHIPPGDRAPVDRELLLRRQSPKKSGTTERKEVPGIDMESALQRVMGNRALLGKLLFDFRRDYGNATQEVRTFLAQGELERGRCLVHQIKGVASNMGERALHEAARTLEQAIKQGRESDWPALTDTFEAAMREILTTISTLQLIFSEATTVQERCEDHAILNASDWETLKFSLIELANHLTRFSVGSMATFNAIRPQLLQTGLRSEVEQMMEQMNQFKFKEARTSLEEIAKLEIFL